jgi:Sigma-70, region 4
MKAVMHLKLELHNPPQQRIKGRRKAGKRASRYPEKEYIKRLLQVNELYIRFGTLQRVAEHLHLSRERVRQLLQKGHDYKLFTFELTKHRVLNQLRQRISRAQIVRAIRNGVTPAGICSKFHIDKYSYLTLLAAYKIDKQGYIQELAVAALLQWIPISCLWSPAQVERQRIKKGPLINGHVRRQVAQGQ